MSSEILEAVRNAIRERDRAAAAVDEAIAQALDDEETTADEVLEASGYRTRRSLYQARDRHNERSTR